jgi:hypothetical protein
MVQDQDYEFLRTLGKEKTQVLVTQVMKRNRNENAWLSLAALKVTSGYS